MPAKSEAQFRAMQAAAHGNSTLGIPVSVGKEFTKEPMTGMPFGKKRKTRRGRRHSASVGDHFAHMREAHQHAKNGDHKNAKAALFRAIKAMPTPDESETEHNPREEAMEPAEQKPMTKTSTSRSPALLALLARNKK